MSIPKNPSERLAKPDSDLFRQGACHVLAEALVRRFSDQGYRLRIMEDEQWLQSGISEPNLFREKTLVHVYAECDGWMIDVSGIRREEDYLREHERRLFRAQAMSIESYKAFARDCGHEEIFTVAKTEEETGPMNKDRLYLHPEFLREAGERAEQLIQATPELFDLRAHIRDLEKGADQSHPNS